MSLFSLLKTSSSWGTAHRQLTKTSQSASKSFYLGHFSREVHVKFSNGSPIKSVGASERGATYGLGSRTWNGASSQLWGGGAQKLLHKQVFNNFQKLLNKGQDSSATVNKLQNVGAYIKRSWPLRRPQVSPASSVQTARFLHTYSIGSFQRNFPVHYKRFSTRAAKQSTRVWQQLQGAGKLVVLQSRIQGSLGRLRQQVSLFRGGNFRQGYSRQDPNTILYGLIGANVVVWLFWSQPKLQAFMSRHFLASVDAIANGRLHTIITANFSHTDGSHILLNMISLYFFGQSVGYHYGGKALLGLYLAGGVGCMAGYCLYWTYVVPWREGLNPRWYNPRRTSPCQGASGSVMAIMMLSILTDPFRTVYVNLFIPVPALLFGAFVVYSDLSGAIGRDYSSRVGYSGHLGGAAVGAAAWAYLRRFRFR